MYIVSSWSSTEHLRSSLLDERDLDRTRLGTEPALGQHRTWNISAKFFPLVRCVTGSEIHTSGT
jgi:hypothetical protein